MTDEELRAIAVAFAKKNKEVIAEELTDSSIYRPDEDPVSVFMAGSPGAGKTEFSKALLVLLENRTNHRILRIDSDDFRPLIPGYTGENSHIFHGAVSLIAEKVQDYALSNRQTFIFDGTFSKYEKAEDNIRRSLKKGRRVFVFYVYQSPLVAWKFTLAREKAEGRRIPKSAFIEQFIGARESVEQVRAEFSDLVGIVLVKKDFEKNRVEDIVDISVDQPIDAHIPERYTKDDLENIL